MYSLMHSSKWIVSQPPFLYVDIVISEQPKDLQCRFREMFSLTCKATSKTGRPLSFTWFRKKRGSLCVCVCMCCVTGKKQYRGANGSEWILMVVLKCPFCNCIIVYFHTVILLCFHLRYFKFQIDCVNNFCHYIF